MPPSHQYKKSSGQSQIDIWHDVKAKGEITHCIECESKGKKKRIWSYWHTTINKGKKDERYPEMDKCAPCFFK